MGVFGQGILGTVLEVGRPSCDEVGQTLLRGRRPLGGPEDREGRGKRGATCPEAERRRPRGT